MIPAELRIQLACLLAVGDRPSLADRLAAIRAETTQ